MGHLYCHANPDVMTLETNVTDARPGRVLLADTPFYPGGGGQPGDQGTLAWEGGACNVTGFDFVDGEIWLVLDQAVEITGSVEARVDPDFRGTMRQLHTDTHILNALVYEAFNGALVTGVQIYGDGTARMDFDLPEADNDILRALEPRINEIIAANLSLRFDYVTADEAQAQHGLIRSRSVAPPPTEDGRVRIVEIVGLDRQACGGTHLASTGQSPAVKILKVDNKGRHNRRIRIGLVAGV